MSFKHLIAAALIAAPGVAAAQDTPAPEGAEVYFVSLEDGATIASPVTIVFGLSGMGVAPAGTDSEMTGHHHLFLNRAPLGESEEGAEELLYGIPADDNHIHFGGGQTQVTLDLEPGDYTMQLVIGDLNHVPHVPPIASDQITVTVE